MPVMRGIASHVCGAIAAVVLALLPVAASAQSSPSPHTTGTRYDLLRRVVGTIAPQPDATSGIKYAAVRNTYDQAGRLVRVETGELSAWQSEAVLPSDWTGFTVFRQVDTVYDELDRKVRETVYGNGAPYALTQYSYDPLGRVECTVMRMNQAAFGGTQPGPCALGAPGSPPQDGGPDRITKQLYDGDGRLIQVRKGVGTALEQAYSTYDYTDNGFQRTVIDANGNRAQLSYDGFDRQSRWEFPLPSLPSGFNPSTPASALSSAGASNAGDYESYGYDANGNRTSWRKRDGRAFAYGFDALNRMTVKTVPDGCAPLQVGACPPAAATRDVYYGYDAWGRQTAARYDAAGGADGIANGYDGFGRLTASSSSLGGITQALGYGYDADGNRVLVVHPDSVAFSYGYDGLDRLTGIAQGATALTARSYNARGELTAESRGAVATSYGHDPISRLTSLHDELAGTSADVTSGYQYNPAGQIVIRTRDNDGYASSAYRNVDEAYQRNGLNQYTQVGTAPFGYDAAGNLVIGDDGYGYDAENRLIAVSGGHAATLGYDPLGRLWSVAGASATTRFVHDGDALALEYDGAGTLLRRYVHGNGEDDPLLWYEGAGLSDKRSLQVDHQGSIVSVADASGNPLEIDSYDEYGTRGTANTARFQFTGQVWLGEAGLYYYKARFYDPRIGRFLQVDPIGYKDQANLYAYVANDPVNRRDPTGTQLSRIPEDLAELYKDFKADPVATVLDMLGGLEPNPISSITIEASAARSVVRTEAAATVKSEKTFQTYLKANAETGQKYTGRTSGTGTPAQNVARRDAANYPSKDYGPARLDKSSTNPQAIKGREQQMIERNGGAQSQGGTSGNKINGISDRNRSGPACRAAASKEFGPC